MKRRSGILIIAGIAIAALVSVVAVSTHLRLSALEGEEEPGNESLQEIANEVLTGQPAHTEEGEKPEGAVNNTDSSHSESEETAEERAAEGK